MGSPELRVSRHGPAGGVGRRAGRPSGSRTRLLVERAEPVSVGLAEIAFLRMRLEGIEPRSAWLRCMHGADADEDVAEDVAAIERQRWAIQRRLVDLAQAADAAWPVGSALPRLARHVQVLLTSLRDADAVSGRPALPRVSDDHDDFDSILALGRSNVRAAGVSPTGFRASFGLALEDDRSADAASSFDRSPVAAQVEAVNAVASALGLSGRGLPTAGAVGAVPADRIEKWFSPRIAARLSSHGVLAVRDLAALVLGDPGRWHRRLRRVGVIQASRIEAWLSALPWLPPLEKDVLRGPPGASSCAWYSELMAWTREAGVPGVVGLAYQLLGSMDVFDVRAFSRDWAWAGERAAALGGPDATRLARAAQGERFVLWLHLVYRANSSPEGMPSLSAPSPPCPARLRRALDGYELFLENIPASWIGAKAARRSDTGWRPFRGPLSEHSRACALSSLRRVLNGSTPVVDGGRAS